jgi:hypothetical protein
MPVVKILAGAHKQDAIYMGGILHLRTVDGAKYLYNMKDAVERISKLSEDKKSVLFELFLRDGKEIRAESINSVFHEFAKFAGTSVNPQYVTVVPIEKVKRGDTITAWVTIIVVVGILYSCMAVSDEPAAPPSPITGAELESYAAVYCKDLVKNSLKSPKSADFPWGDRAIFSGGQYVMNSYVDAQNSFGAEIRTHFRCVLQHSGNDEYSGWTVKDLQVYE